MSESEKGYIHLNNKAMIRELIVLNSRNKEISKKRLYRRNTNDIRHLLYLHEKFTRTKLAQLKLISDTNQVSASCEAYIEFRRRFIFILKRQGYKNPRVLCVNELQIDLIKNTERKQLLMSYLADKV